MNQVVIEETSFEEVLSEIEENSKYKRLPPKEKTWMTVPEIGNLLGLKKTGRYWLVQKNYFECREIAGQMRVNIASFEKWYANQVKYHKVNGEEPGKNLKKWSYSISEVAKMLGISETTVYDLIRRDGIKQLLLITGSGFRKNLFRNGMRSNRNIAHRKTGKRTRSWKEQQLPCQKWQGFWEFQDVRYMRF